MNEYLLSKDNIRKHLFYIHAQVRSELISKITRAVNLLRFLFSVCIAIAFIHIPGLWVAVTPAVLLFLQLGLPVSSYFILCFLPLSLCSMKKRRWETFWFEIYAHYFTPLLLHRSEDNSAKKYI